VEIALYLVLLLVGLAAALAASELAVSYTRALAAGLGAPPFLVGVVLVAVGTDLPEIATRSRATCRAKATSTSATRSDQRSPSTPSSSVSFPSSRVRS